MKPQIPYIAIAVLIIIFTAFLVNPNVAESSGYKPNTSEFILDNGLKVLVTEEHKAPLAVFQIWYRVGGMDETTGLTGMSHLLEHMMFKGTAKYGSKLLSRTVQKNGGTDNAFTSKNFTAYYQMLPSERIGLSMDFESDRMRGLILDSDETLAERSVVMEERRMRYVDNPQNSLYEQVVSAAFTVHPYQNPVIGWMSDLGNITRQDLQKHYRKYYSPNNAVIVIVGDVDTNDMLAKIKKSFGHIKPGPPIRRIKYNEPPQNGQRKVVLKKEAKLPYYIAAYHTPGYVHPDAIALEVLAELLGGGKSSRLYRALVYESRLALSVSADYVAMGRDPFLFFIDAEAAPGKDIAEVQKALDSEIARLSKNPPSDFEMRKAKNSLQASFIMGQDSLYRQAMITGMLEMIGGWRLKETYLDSIESVTVADVLMVAQKYLQADKSTQGILVPIDAGAKGEDK